MTTQMDMNKVTVSLLGTVRVRHGINLVFPYRNCEAVLVYLLSENLPVCREHLANLIWPADTSSDPRQNLRQALTSLKRLFGPLYDKSFSVSRNSVEFVGHDFFNVDTALLKQQSTSLYSFNEHSDMTNSYSDILGELSKPFYGNFKAAGRDELNEWVVSHRESCQHMAKSVARQVVTYCAERMQSDEMVNICKQFVAIDRDDTSLIHDAMNVLIGCDQIIQAASIYDNHRARLIRHYGLSPNTMLTSLYDSLGIKHRHANSEHDDVFINSKYHA